MAKTTRNAMMPKADIEAQILEVLQELGRDVVGLTTSEIHIALRSRRIEIGQKQVTDIVKIMVKKGIVEVRPHPRRRNWRCFNLPGKGVSQLFLFDRQMRRDEIEREERSGFDLWQEDEIERERFTVSVMEEIAQGHAMEESYAREVREVAHLVAEENPVDLLLELAEWVRDDINSLANQAQKAKEQGKENAQRLIRELGFRRAKAENFLQRLWRLDRSPKHPVENAVGILDIPTVPRLLQGERVILNVPKAKERLQQRVFGKRVVEIVDVPSISHRAAVGTDASVGDVWVEHARGSFIPPTPAVLFVAAAAMRVKDKEHKWHYWDYDIDPRDLQKYRDIEAAVEGLLISPHLRREVITDFRHLRSAAMELRQYREERRVILQESKWHPISGVPELHHPPTVTLLVRDGRIFPLVHRLEDYEGASAPDDVLYGEVVRREIRTFREVFHNTAGRPNGAVYAGAVKAPEFSWLAMLTFWYLHAKQGRKVPAETFYRPPLTDQAVIHLLFWGLAEHSPEESFSNERKMFVTFRVLRRFSDIAFSLHPLFLEGKDGNITRVVNEDDLDDWEEYIKQHIEDSQSRYAQHRRGIPALESVEEYAPFTDLCYRAGVVMFYGAPTRMYRATLKSNAHFFTPRWEVAVDVSNKGEVEKRAWSFIQKLSAWLTEADGLVVDETHAVGGFEEVSEGLPLFIPDVVLEAHNAVGYGRDRHTADVKEELHKIVRKIREAVFSWKDNER